MQLITAMIATEIGRVSAFSTESALAIVVQAKHWNGGEVSSDEFTAKVWAVDRNVSRNSIQNLFWLVLKNILK